MYVALVNKVNGNFQITDFVEFNNQDLKLFENYVKIDEITKLIYNSLVNKYDKVYIKEEAVLKHSVTKDSFIPISIPKTGEGYTPAVDESSKIYIEKVKLYQELDKNTIASAQDLNFLNYIHYINLFNYFASKGIFITEENKEDKYIEILDLDDETAVEKLELFLTLQDKIEGFLEKNTKNIELKEQIEYADEDELEELKEKILPKVVV